MTKSPVWLWLMGILLLAGTITTMVAGYQQGKNHVVASRINIETGSLLLHVIEDGVYSISLADLNKAGVSLDPQQWQPNNLSLSSQGSEIPYYWHQDRLMFFGRQMSSVYTNKRPYILTIAPDTDSLQTEVRSAQPTTTENTITSIVKRTLRLEENLEYISTAYQPDYPDTWFWHTIHVQQDFSFTFDLPQVATGSGEVTMQFFGTSEDPQLDNDHDLDWRINQQDQQTIIWDGNKHHTTQHMIADGTLQTGENEIVLDNTAVGTAFVDIMQLDWLELTYDAPAVTDKKQALSFYTTDQETTIENSWLNPMLWDVTDPNRPILLEDALIQENRLTFQASPNQHIYAVDADRLQAPPSITLIQETDLLSQNNQADLIIITTSDLAPSMEPMVEARQEQGLTVKLVTVDNLYQHFGAGLEAPDSIQSFLAYTAEKWQAPMPRYVLLVGTSINDYRENLDTYPNQIPSPMVPVVHSGETVSDARLADIDGDAKPDMAIGRWPVDNIANVQSLVRRTLAYEKGTASDGLLFTADGSSSEFTGLSDQIIANSNTPSTNINKLYGATFTEVANAWNQGSWLVSYVGHGSINLWGQDEVFTRDAVSQLTEGDFAPPIVLQFTCLTGYFAHPTQRSISELMLTHEAGPVLLVGATSLTYSTDQQSFAENLLQSLQNSDQTRIGDALQSAKRPLDVTKQGTREVSDTFGLLGDPSALIIRP